MTDPIEIDGLEEVIRKLDGLDDPGVFRRPMQESVFHIHREIAKYPPATAANRPPGRNGYSWYVRGFGTRTVTGKAYATSQRLGASWTTEVSPDGRQGRVGTKVTYAPYVQGERQTSYHEETGWQTAREVARREQRAVVGYFERQYERYARS